MRLSAGLYKLPPVGNQNLPPTRERGVRMEKSVVCLLPMTVSGGNDMVKADVWHEIHSRFKLKETKKSIARCGEMGTTMKS